MKIAPITSFFRQAGVSEIILQLTEMAPATGPNNVPGVREQVINTTLPDVLSARRPASRAKAIALLAPKSGVAD